MSKRSSAAAAHASALSSDTLRWHVDETSLAFDTTAQVDPAEGIVGQPIAREAMRFGVECDAPGQNIYVRGVTGTGRMTLVTSLLGELQPQARRRLDRSYVHNFARPDRPRLVTLPAGHATRFRRRMGDLADFVRDGLREWLESPAVRAGRQAILDDTQERIRRITEPLEQELEEHGLRMVPGPAGSFPQVVLFPLVGGNPVPPDEYARLVRAGSVTEEARRTTETHIKEFRSRLGEVSSVVSQIHREGKIATTRLLEEEARAMLEGLTRDTRADFDTPAVATFLGEVVEDIVEHRLEVPEGKSLPDPDVVYGVHVVCSHDAVSDPPVVTETAPTVASLIGTIEPDFGSGGKAMTTYRGVRVGALVHADGGYLVLDAEDVMAEPGAWRRLMRALRTGCVEITPSEGTRGAPALKPEPIDISVRIILLGSSGLYYQLDRLDHDFSNLFKVLADFDAEIERSMHGVQQYAGVVARLVRDEDLLHFTAGGVAALAEHGARIASRQGKITARFGRIADIAREASFMASKVDATTVGREHVVAAVRRTRYRASLPSKRFQELVRQGTIRVETSGEVVGQINGLAVIQAGPLTYGFPARLTATIGAGQAGIINIEGAAAMSGAIHTKGFHILGGLLRHLLRTEHPLAFSASIAFEQSYGGIDGDSASGAEICCLLSALTDVPIRQGIAMTGAIDQHGHIQAIGGVNEKIEGFFDVCETGGLDGRQGVLIPRANAGDLMLRDDVVDACAGGNFAIFAVSTVYEALEVLTGHRVYSPDANGRYPEGSLLRRARQKAREYWQKTSLRPYRSGGPALVDDD